MESSVQASNGSSGRPRAGLSREQDIATRSPGGSDVLVVILDGQGRLVRLNGSCERLSGCASADVQGRYVWDLFVVPEEVEMVKAVVEELQKGEPSNRYEACWPAADGQRRLIAWSNTLLAGQDGSAAYIVSAGIDITDCRAAEERLQQCMLELQARDEELNTLAHTVGHDLKDPLGPIIGFAEILEDAYGTVPAEEAREYLGSIARNARKINNVVDRLWLLIELRTADVEMMPLDMGSIVAQARHRLADELEERQAEIVVPAVWPDALGYGPWVEQVWITCLSNAVRHGGRLPRLTLGAEVQADGMVCFWISDGGPMPAQEAQDRPFRSSAQHDQVRVAGHDLGLSIARRIVTRLGGKVEVESGGFSGQGMVLCFTLPALAVPGGV